MTKYRVYNKWKEPSGKIKGRAYFNKTVEAKDMEQARRKGEYDNREWRKRVHSPHTKAQPFVYKVQKVVKRKRKPQRRSLFQIGGW